MNDKQFTDELFRRMYDLGYRKAEIESGTVDTPIFVRNRIEDMWKCRYFAKYEDGKVYTWCGGRTSWSNVIAYEPVNWEYAELAFKE